MPVVGLNLRSFEAQREEEIQGNLKVNNSPQIKDVSKKAVGSLDQEALSIDFDYVCSYTAEDGDDTLAEIKIGGEVLFLADDPEEVMENWEENKELPDEIVIPVINRLMRKSLTKAVDISEDLQLPPPIRFPRAKKQAENTRYIG